ncbi:MAG: starch synthase, partial [Ruminiclostridium sp.]|nr:starch synthase [Ruminiclostridium sp.]
MKDAIVRAITVYQDKGKWGNLVKQCMGQDFSWVHSAMDYKKLYGHICGITVTK